MAEKKNLFQAAKDKAKEAAGSLENVKLVDKESYLKNQYVLDEQMQIRFNAFQKELEEEATRFKDLLGDAFDPDFRKALSGSAEIARNVGVEEKEILKSLDEVDDFFLS